MNLYRLERMKLRLSTYLWAIFGIFASLLALGILFLFLPQIEQGGTGVSEEAALFASWNGLLVLLTALGFAFFSIFSAALAAKLIISEYCGRNAVVLLCYPVKRNVILGAKCLIVCGMTTIPAFISNLFVIGILNATAHIFRIVPHMSTDYFVFTVLLSSLFMGLSSSAVGIISTALGWKKRSAIAAIVCSLIIVCSLTNSIVIFPSTIIWTMLAMSAVLVITATFLYHILANEIAKMEV